MDINPNYETFDCEEFYRLCIAYRHTATTNQDTTCSEYKNLQNYCARALERAISVRDIEIKRLSIISPICT